MNFRRATKPSTSKFEFEKINWKHPAMLKKSLSVSKSSGQEILLLTLSSLNVNLKKQNKQNKKHFHVE